MILDAKCEQTAGERGLSAAGPQLTCVSEKSVPAYAFADPQERWYLR